MTEQDYILIQTDILYRAIIERLFGELKKECKDDINSLIALKNVNNINKLWNIIINRNGLQNWKKKEFLYHKLYFIIFNLIMKSLGI